MNELESTRLLSDPRKNLSFCWQRFADGHVQKYPLLEFYRSIRTHKYMTGLSHKRPP